MEQEINSKESEIGMVLKERVWEYILHNRSGVNIMKLENEFGESRMRLGYIINNLIDEGRIQKSDSSYIPSINYTQ